MDRLLRVTADDYGFTPGVTDGILEAYRDGIVTHASIMANGLDFERSCHLISNTDFNIGIHLVATWGQPILNAKKNCSLINSNKRFHSLNRFIKLILLKKISASDLFAEWDAQIKKIIQMGVVPTHMDSHHHIHLLPTCFSVICELVEKYNIKYIRKPVEVYSIINCHQRLLKRGIFNILSKRKWPVKSSNNFIGISSQNKKTFPKILMKYLNNLPFGHTEFMTHPGYVDNILIREDSLLNSRQIELKALCSQETKNIIIKKSIKLDRK